MKNDRKVELVQADLATYLGRLVDDLRVGSLVLSGGVQQDGETLFSNARKFWKCSIPRWPKGDSRRIHLPSRKACASA